MSIGDRIRARRELTQAEREERARIRRLRRARILAAFEAVAGLVSAAVRARAKRGKHDGA